MRSGRVGHLADDPLRGGVRIRLGGDRTADHEEVRPGVQGLARRHHPALVVCTAGGGGRADAGDDDGQIRAEPRPEQTDLVRTGHHPAQSAGDTQCRQAHHLIGHPVGHARFSQRRRIAARQDRDAEQPELAPRLGGGSAEHRRTSREVHGEEINVQGARRPHRARDRVGDVVQLQVEENPRPGSGRLDFPDDAGPAAGEEFEADFEERHDAAELFDEPERRRFVGNVERQDDFVFRLAGSCHKVRGCFPMKWLAPAKINLSLRVLGRREDGFHEIETLMVPLSLADEVEIELRAGAAPIELVCSDPSLPTGPGNLAYRAAEVFRRAVAPGLPPVRITLTKHVPHGAGLGGGSSDAAAVLLGLDQIHGSRQPVARLAALAAELGSDVPFFVYRSAAVCRGRGDRVEPVPFSARLSLLLLKPPFPVPTPWAYRRWRESRPLPGVLYAAQTFVWGELVNDLERPVFEKYLLLAELKTWLLGQPEVAGALLSGSGSTVLAVLHDPGTGAEALAARARDNFGELWTLPCETAPSNLPSGDRASAPSSGTSAR